MAKRISIINFKGGVGKTTLAFHLGTGLAMVYESKVLLIDVDHQSSLSILCLRADGWERAIEEHRTVDEIFRPFVSSHRPFPGDEILISSPMHNVDTDYDGMDIVPASLQLDDTEIELTATHQGNAIHSEWNKRTLICRWIEEAEIDKKYDYIIFDCPPATKLVSQNAIAASHGYIIPVVPEAVMERGTPHLRNMMQSGIDAKLKALAPLGETRAAYVPDTELIGIVITQIQVARGGFTIDHSQHLDSLQRNWGDSLVTPYIYQGVGVKEALTRGLPVYNLANTQNVGGRGIHEQFYELTDEIIRRIDAL